MLNQTYEPTIQLIDGGHAISQLHPDPWAQFGIAVALIILVSFYFILGMLHSRPSKLERQLIGRALRTSPAPEDQILLERYQKLLDNYRQKPGEKS